MDYIKLLKALTKTAGLFPNPAFSLLLTSRVLELLPADPTGEASLAAAGLTLAVLGVIAVTLTVGRQVHSQSILNSKKSDRERRILYARVCYHSNIKGNLERIQKTFYGAGVQN